MLADAWHWLLTPISGATEHVITALMAWLFFNERLALLGLLGMAICVTGVFLVNWRTGGASA